MFKDFFAINCLLCQIFYDFLLCNSTIRFYYLYLCKCVNLNMYRVGVIVLQNDLIIRLSKEYKKINKLFIIKLFFLFIVLKFLFNFVFKFSQIFSFFFFALNAHVTYLADHLSLYVSILPIYIVNYLLMYINNSLFI